MPFDPFDLFGRPQTPFDSLPEAIRAETVALFALQQIESHVCAYCLEPADFLRHRARVTKTKMVLLHPWCFARLVQLYGGLGTPEAPEPTKTRLWCPGGASQGDEACADII